MINFSEEVKKRPIHISKSTRNKVHKQFIANHNVLQIYAAIYLLLHPQKHLIPGKRVLRHDYNE